jgi:hypothetical protein
MKDEFTRMKTMMGNPSYKQIAIVLGNSNVYGNSDSLIVMEEQISLLDKNKYEIRSVKKFENSNVPRENYTVYLIDKK